MKLYSRLFPRIGRVRFERRKRTRHYNLFVEPYRGVRVSFPWHGSLKEAEELVSTHLDWIRRKQNDLNREYKPQLDLFSTIDKDEAKEALISRTRELAAQHGLACGRVTVRQQKTRWGSCSHNNNLSLNLKLHRLPPELRDYIILHELVHTRVHSHGKHFWEELEKILPPARTLDARMKQFHLDKL